MEMNPQKEEYEEIELRERLRGEISWSKVILVQTVFSSTAKVIGHASAERPYVIVSTDHSSP